MIKILKEYDKDDPDIVLSTYRCQICNKLYKDDAEQKYNPNYYNVCSSKCFKIYEDQQPFKGHTM